jgi:hypothetical protein
MRGGVAISDIASMVIEASGVVCGPIPISDRRETLFVGLSMREVARLLPLPRMREVFQ